MSLFFTVTAGIALAFLFWRDFRVHRQVKQLTQELASRTEDLRRYQLNEGDIEAERSILHEELVNKLRNNLQLVMSVLSIHTRALHRSSYKDQECNELELKATEIRTAVEVLSLASAAAFSNKESRIKIGPYLTDLGARLSCIYGDGADVKVEAYLEHHLNFSDGVALGMIVNAFYASLEAANSQWGTVILNKLNGVFELVFRTSDRDFVICSIRERTMVGDLVKHLNGAIEGQNESEAHEIIIRFSPGHEAA